MRRSAPAEAQQIAGLAMQELTRHAPPARPAAEGATTDEELDQAPRGTPPATTVLGAFSKRAGIAPPSPPISPVLLGRGENLLAGIDTVKLGYKCAQHATTDRATHVVLTK